jgi:hypothetical protein
VVLETLGSGCLGVLPSPGPRRLRLRSFLLRLRRPGTGAVQHAPTPVSNSVVPISSVTRGAVEAVMTEARGSLSSFTGEISSGNSLLCRDRWSPSQAWISAQSQSHSSASACLMSL